MNKKNISAFIFIRKQLEIEKKVKETAGTFPILPNIKFFPKFNNEIAIKKIKNKYKYN